MPEPRIPICVSLIFNLGNFFSVPRLLWHDKSHSVYCALEKDLFNQSKVGEPQQTFNYCIVNRHHVRKSAVGPSSVQRDEIEMKIGL